MRTRLTLHPLLAATALMAATHSCATQAIRDEERREEGAHPGSIYELHAFRALARNGSSVLAWVYAHAGLSTGPRRGRPAPSSFGAGGSSESRAGEEHGTNAVH